MNKTIITNTLIILLILILLAIIYKIWGDISNLQLEFINLKKINEDLFLKINSLEAENKSLQNIINNENKKLISLIESRNFYQASGYILLLFIAGIGIMTYFDPI